MLFLEFHGSEEGVAEQSRRFGEIAEEYGGGPFVWTAHPEERTRPLASAPRCLVGLRGRCAPARGRSRPTSACRSRGLRTASRKRNATSPKASSSRPSSATSATAISITTPLIDVSDPDEIARAEAFSSRLAKRAIAMEGTCTGEHGIGQQKIPYLELERGEMGLELMRRVKLAYDPQNLFNPGKIFRE